MLNNIVVICMLLAFHEVAGQDINDIQAILDDKTALYLLGIGTTAELPRADAVVPAIGALRLEDFVITATAATPRPPTATRTHPGGLS